MGLTSITSFRRENNPPLNILCRLEYFSSPESRVVIRDHATPARWNCKTSVWQGLRGFRLRPKVSYPSVAPSSIYLIVKNSNKSLTPVSSSLNPCPIDPLLFPALQSVLHVLPPAISPQAAAPRCSCRTCSAGTPRSSERRSIPLH